MGKFDAEVVADFTEARYVRTMMGEVLMFRKCGVSITMGNPSDEVTRQASAVTESSENEGFAKAIHYYVPGEATQ